MSEPASPASVKAPSVDAPRRAPRVFLTATWPLFLFVGVCVAVAALINSFTILRCERGDVPGGGMCHLDRGSMAFNYRESFFVDDLTGAQLNSKARDDTINRRDLGGERIYLQVGREQHRFIDNGAWDTSEREQKIAEIAAFIDDPAQPALEVAYDRRVRLLFYAFALGLLLGSFFAAARVRKLRLEDLE